MRSTYSTRDPGRRGGFTLVELLVVIGIIALLISILLPSLNSARKSAQKVKCQANLHNLGNALLVYASSNRGRLPASTLTSTRWSGDGWLWDIEIPTRDMLVKSGASRQSFYCPSAPANLMDYDFVWTYNGADFSNDAIATFLRGKTEAERSNGIGILGYVCLIQRPPGANVATGSPGTYPGISYPAPGAVPGPGTMQDAGNLPTVIGDQRWNVYARTWKFQKSIVPDNKGCVVYVAGGAPAFQKSSSSSETEIFADVVGSVGTSNDFSILPGGLPKDLYQGSSHLGRNKLPVGANVLFLDGHVSWRPFSNGSTFNPSSSAIGTRPADYFNQDVIHWRCSGTKPPSTDGINWYW